jgi:hypothetical protein
MLTDEFDAVLVGPGMRASVALDSIVAWVAHRFPVAVIVLDAGALSALPGTGALPAAQGPRALTRCIATPHAGEMAGLLDAAKEEVRADAGPIAAATAARWNAVVTLKGAVTHVASPNGQRWIHDRPNPGLAVSGSGDVLAGLVAGLAARGATAEQAAVWAVVACLRRRSSRVASGRAAFSPAAVRHHARRDGRVGAQQEALGGSVRRRRPSGQPTFAPVARRHAVAAARSTRPVTRSARGRRRRHRERSIVPRRTRRRCAGRCAVRRRRASTAPAARSPRGPRRADGRACGEHHGMDNSCAGIPRACCRNNATQHTRVAPANSMQSP